MLELVGQQLGNYRLIQSLGHGGYAEVYLGEHLRLNTAAAIKVLHARLGSSEDIDRFQEEGRIVASLVHPHIVRVFDFDVAHDIPFMVMDYAPNGSLRRRHPKGERLALSTILPYVKQVAEALQYAHDQHFVHRDIKPENMLLGRNEEVLLSDFGTAQVAQNTGYQNAMQEEVVGTVSYMAPEQFQGRSRPASDQYSLAVVIYEWLAGELPFHGSGTEVAIQHTMAPVPPLHEKRPDIGAAIEQVLMKALAKDYHERYPCIQDFAEALEHASQIDASFYTEPTQAVTALPQNASMVAAEPQNFSPQQHVITPQELKPAPLMMDSVTSTALHAPSPTPLPQVAQQGEVASFSPPVPPTQNEPYFYPPPARRPRPWLVVMLLLALLMFIGSGLVWYWFILPHLGSTPLGSQATGVYPNVAGTYNGSIDNTTAHITTSMGLAMQQNQGKINGQFTVGSALTGSGPFTGTIDTAKHLRFTVASFHGNAPLLFDGAMQSDGSLSGNYCSVGSNGQCDAAAGAGGTWKVSKAASIVPTLQATVAIVTASVQQNNGHHKKEHQKH
ncbi:MAG: hypothetical protein NVSMB27_37580 [Ktedonobacteraceae bacterium]